MRLSDLGFHTLQTQALINQSGDTEATSRLREGFVVLAILSPAILGLILTSFPIKSGRT